MTHVEAWVMALDIYARELRLVSAYLPPGLCNSGRQELNAILDRPRQIQIQASIVKQPDVESLRHFSP